MTSETQEVAIFEWLAPDGGPARRTPVWLRFDETWYRSRYPQAAKDLVAGVGSDALGHYRAVGQVRGYSPNRWFDEGWYLATCPDVVAAVEAGTYRSGFMHYVQEGYRERSPHWLFSEKYYRTHTPDLTGAVLKSENLANGYDHYLAGGECDFRSGSRFFDPEVFRHYTSGCHDLPGLSAFEQFLVNADGVADRTRASWYFDPVWYLTRYPDVGQLIAEKRVSGALHHYLTLGEQAGYSPQAAFSEEFYREKYPDVSAGVGAGLFRSGYDHFLTAGAFEGRQPAPDAPLAEYAARPMVRADVESGIFRDPFAHWVASREQTDRAPDDRSIDEAHSKMMFVREAAGLLVEAGRRTLDFSRTEPPTVSVIMVLHNQFPLTMMALASLRDCFPGSLELIVIDSGSRDETVRLEQYVTGAKIRHLDYNASFLLSCNMALDMVSADAVLYLNNDVKLAPGAVQIALDRLASDGRIGAVGGKIIRTNGLLQEAGSIIWRDGGAYGYLRDRDPNCPEANFVRDVDYCSGAFLLTSTSLARSLNGFDTAYAPAYFEESDYCVRLIRNSYRVVYDPSVVIEHLEFGSSTSAASMALMQRNRRIFVTKQAEFLRNQYPAHLGNAVLARSRPAKGPRVLFIEDRVPLRSLGSGYVRSNDIVRSLVRQGCAVTVFPVDAHYHSLSRLYGDFPDTVEVLFDRSAEDLDSFLEERAGAFDLVWIGRTHNLARLRPLLDENSRYLPGTRFILDTEAVVTPRLQLRDDVLGLTKGRDGHRPQDLDEALRAEFECAYFCQQVVAVTGQDAALVRRAGHQNVAVLGHSVRPRPTPASFAERQGLLFVGSIVDEHSPNLDSLLWFAREVMPRLRDTLGSEVRLTAVGSRSRKVDLSTLYELDGIDIIGEVDELEPFYNTRRVFVAPTRFAGGIPYKIHESAAFGLPVVASDLLIGQLGWTEGRDILSGGAPDAQAFAAAVTRLYQDEALWSGIRDAALRRIEEDCDPARFDAAVASVLEGARR
ncbi:glycosyltransferase [Acetobacter conturbans]|uniref:Glycosyltransferase n=1 Tax=Acetobacter conturbans TaxID=1737472 RepID=A0ABX0JVX1_9PROT|nr:glycosyltransferase [Acetobacter conturbans]NHN87434.1 glycosyltransferase [Acetobacter conturbans]